MINIQLLGRPGVGKSTVAAELYSEMKKLGKEVELCGEYAKDLVWSEDYFTLNDQLMVFAKQRHRLWKLEGKVDYTINDGPFILSNIYYCHSEHLEESLFKKLVLSSYKSYDNINILLTRNGGYVTNGRNKNEEESLQVECDIRRLLNKSKMKFIEFDIGKENIKKLLDIIL